MTLSDLISLYNQDQRIDIVYPDIVREATPQVVRHISRFPGGESFVIHSSLTAGNADAVIAEQIAYFEDIGQGFEWKAYSFDAPADLVDRLRQHGFEIQEPDAIMVLDISGPMPGALGAAHAHTVRKIDSVAGLDDVSRVEEAVWLEERAEIRQMLADAIENHPEQMSIYVAYVEDEPACAGWVYFPPNSDFASLWGGSTVRRFRRRGVYSALLATRLLEARQRGRRYLTVDASSMSRPILEKLGFVTIGTATPCKWRVK